MASAVLEPSVALKQISGSTADEERTETETDALMEFNMKRLAVSPCKLLYDAFFENFSHKSWIDIAPA